MAIPKRRNSVAEYGIFRRNFTLFFRKNIPPEYTKRRNVRKTLLKDGIFFFCGIFFFSYFFFRNLPKGLYLKDGIWNNLKLIEKCPKFRAGKLGEYVRKWGKSFILKHIPNPHWKKLSTTLTSADKIN